MARKVEPEPASVALTHTEQRVVGRMRKIRRAAAPVVDGFRYASSAAVAAIATPVAIEGAHEVSENKLNLVGWAKVVGGMLGDGSALWDAGKALRRTVQRVRSRRG